MSSPTRPQAGAPGLSRVGALFGPEARVNAADFKIAGFEPFSTVDWPDKLVTTVFAQGCPWRCGYCHNPESQSLRTPGAVSWATVAAHLADRVGKLDGVVFSGGEPTVQRELIPVMQEAASFGFGVGLHSAGAYPGRLREALRYADWLGLDIKALPEGYEDITGVPVSGAKAWESLAIALEWGGDLEVRLTVDPTHHTRGDVWEIVHRVTAMGGPMPILQEARPDGTSEAYQRELGGRGLRQVLTAGDLAELVVR